MHEIAIENNKMQMIMNVCSKECYNVQVVDMNNSCPKIIVVCIGSQFGMPHFLF